MNKRNINNVERGSLEFIQLKEKLFKNIQKYGKYGCWIWKGAHYHDGYGVINIAKNTQMSAHRLSYEIHNGPIPEGLFICHKCDNPPCCNPHHLFTGTNKDNMNDRNEKQRIKNIKTMNRLSRERRKLKKIKDTL